MQVLFGHPHQRETFNELIHLIHEGCHVIDEGEWVDECNDNVVCYAVSHLKKNGCPGAKKILTLNIQTGELLVVEPSLYYMYSGKIGKLKQEKIARRSGSVGELYLVYPEYPVFHRPILWSSSKYTWCTTDRSLLPFGLFLFFLFKQFKNISGSRSFGGNGEQRRYVVYASMMGIGHGTLF